MALSAGVVCGMATQLLIAGRPVVKNSDVHEPYVKEMCDILRELMGKEGISVVERSMRDDKR